MDTLHPLDAMMAAASGSEVSGAAILPRKQHLKQG
jgi:hypothetical protein